MKTTVVVESLSYYKPMYCSREYQLTSRFPNLILYQSTLQDRSHGTPINKTLNWNSQITRYICPFKSGRSLYKTYKVLWGLMT